MRYGLFSEMRCNRKSIWAMAGDLRASKPFNVVVAALANKLARIAWAVLYHHQAFKTAQQS